VAVDQYTRLGPLPAVATNASRLSAALTDPSLWGLPDDRCRIIRPDTPDDLFDAIETMAHEATDCLFLYYAGHGLIDPRLQTLHLTLPDSAPDRIAETAVAFDEVLGRIPADGGPRRTIVVLDCCDSVPDALRRRLSATGRSNVYVLAACSPFTDAISPGNEECTAFTGEFVDVLWRGVAGDAGYITMDEIYRETGRRLRAKGRPGPYVPVRSGPIDRLPFVRNRARTYGRPSSPSYLGGRPNLRREILTAGAALSLVAATGVVWLTRPAMTGPCSPRVSLLGYSDELDKNNGDNVKGLSGIDWIGRDEAVILNDNRPPIIHTVSLGGSGEFAPVITESLNLKPRDDPSTEEKIDGEGLAVDGDFVHVSSERPPEIRTYHRLSGQQTGRLIVPSKFEDSNAARRFESLTMTSDRTTLYAGMEGALNVDSEVAGVQAIRILKYVRDGPSARFDGPPAEFAYKAGHGLYLVDLVALGGGRLLALERQYVPEGNIIHLYLVTLKNEIAGDRSLAALPADAWADKEHLAALLDCPSARAPVKEGHRQLNPLLDNIEGMDLGETMEDGRQALYLVSDNNGSPTQITRMYKLSVDLREQGMR
jgi:hypothetical protein